MKRSYTPNCGQASSSSKRIRSMAKWSLTKLMFELKSILSADVSLIADKALGNKLLTLRQYNILKDTGTNREEKIGYLLVSVIQKGEQTCKKFILLLKEDKDINETFPSLTEVKWVEPDEKCGRAHSTNAGTNNSKRTGSVETQTIRGYINEVSEIKSGKSTKYFDVVVQSEDENKEMRVFAPARRDFFVSAKRDRKPVQLNKVLPQTSKFNKSGKELLFNKHSDVTILSETLHFPFKVEEDVSLADLLKNKDKSKDCKVNIAVKVIVKSNVGRSSTRAKLFLYHEDYDVADQTARATLIVWKSVNALEEGECYRVTRVTASVHKGSVTLNTTVDSVVEKIASIGETVPCDNPQPVTFTGEIIGANLSLEYTCPKDHLVKVKGTSGKCKTCKVNNSRPHLNKIVHGKLSILTPDKSVQEVEVQDVHLRHLLCQDIIDSNTALKMEKAVVKLKLNVSVTTVRENVRSISVVNR